MSDLPSQIHRYRILSEIGRGAMGRVYLAVDPNIERKIALKVLSPLGVFEPEEMALVHERFLLEGRAAGRLNHPGIVTVYDADSDPASGAPYLAMEWVKGRSLYAMLKDDGHLPVALAVSLASKVARALDYAHRHGVIHRDVKPSNLLVSDDGAVKVVDFGIAKLVSASLTLPGSVLGTPYYMAPEQVKAEPIDGRADLFALGTVLYECLTGRRAFSGDSLSNVNYKILSVQPRPPEMYRSEVPPSLRRVLDRLLAKRPADRYRTGAALADALDAVTEEATAANDGRRSTPIGDAIPIGDADTLSDTEVPGAPPPPATPPLEATVAPPPEASGMAPPPVKVAPTPKARGLVRGLLNMARGLLKRRGRSEPSPASAEQIPVASGNKWLDLSLLMTLVVLSVALVAETPRVLPDLRQAGEGARELLSELLPIGWWESPTAMLEIRFKHHLSLGFISVWIDGKKKMTEKLEVANADLPPPELRHVIAVPRGRHSVEVHVSGVSRKVEAHKMIYAVFAEDERKQLLVELKPGSENLDLILKK